MVPMTAAADAAPLFDARLMPHRSLSPRGFRVLMGALVAASCAIGTLFLTLGAWPVVGYFGLDVLLVWLAFRASFRSGRGYERLRLTTAELAVARVIPGRPPRHWSFQPLWLQVEIDDPPRHDSPLILRSHGRTLAIGAFLTPEERLEVARALRQALARWRGLPPG